MGKKGSIDEMTYFEALRTVLSANPRERKAVMIILSGFVTSIIVGILYLSSGSNNSPEQQTLPITKAQNNVQNLNTEPTPPNMQLYSISCTDLDIYLDKNKTMVNGNIIVTNGAITCDQIKTTVDNNGVVLLRPKLRADQCLNNAYYFLGGIVDNQLMSITTAQFNELLSSNGTNIQSIQPKNAQINTTDPNNTAVTLLGFICL